MKINYFILFIAIILVSCNENNDLASQFNVKGNLSSNNVNIENASVSLDGVKSYQTTTDSKGFFEIKNIERGMYTLSYSKELPDGSTTGNRFNIKVSSDTTMSNLELPSPVILYPPQKIMAESAEISWSSFKSNDFYEYKVFRKEDSGLDETTGKLVHVSTDMNDTVFIDKTLTENSHYYYRVYVMNNFGKMGGSKLVDIQTIRGNYVLNGSFESSIDSIATDWTYIPSYIANDGTIFDFKDYAKVIKDETAPDGQYCLSIDIPVYHYALSFGDLYQFVNGNKMIPGNKYELSYWVKEIALYNFAHITIECYSIGANIEQTSSVCSSSAKNTWKKYSTQFYGSNVNSYKLQLLCGCTIPYNNEPYKILVDNIILQKVE